MQDHSERGPPEAMPTDKGQGEEGIAGPGVVLRGGGIPPALTSLHNFLMSDMYPARGRGEQRSAPAWDNLQVHMWLRSLVQEKKIQARGPYLPRLGIGATCG